MHLIQVTKRCQSRPRARSLVGLEASSLFVGLTIPPTARARRRGRSAAQGNIRLEAAISHAPGNVHDGLEAFPVGPVATEQDAPCAVGLVIHRGNTMVDRPSPMFEGRAASSRGLG
jgi:hypothetical protein